MIARGLWWLLAIVAGWQGIAGAVALAGRVGESAAVPFGMRIVATTEERLRSVLGDDVEFAQALAAVGRPAEWVLWRIDPEPAQRQAMEQRVRLMNELRHVLYPRPVLWPYQIAALLAPVELAERRLLPGQSVLLLCFRGDPPPAGRPGWTLVRREPRIDLWRLQRD